jgi:hypothetical protein
MRLLCPVILILLSTVNRIGHHFPLGYEVATQLIRHDLPWLSATGSHQPPEEALCCCTISPSLQKYINHFAILINSPPQVMPLAVYLDEDIVDVEGIAAASMLSFQAAGIDCSGFDAPQTDGFSAYCDATFSQQIFDVLVAQIKPTVEPGGVRNDVG